MSHLLKKKKTIQKPNHKKYIRKTNPFKQPQYRSHKYSSRKSSDKKEGSRCMRLPSNVVYGNRCINPNPHKWRGYFQDLNLWHPGHEAATLPLHQNSSSIQTIQVRSREILASLMTLFKAKKHCRCYIWPDWLCTSCNVDCNSLYLLQCIHL